MTQVRPFGAATLVELATAINEFYVPSTTHILLSSSLVYDGSEFLAICVEQEVS